MNPRISSLGDAHPLASAPPPADLRHLRNCLGTFATGVTIVTALDRDGGFVGLTANSFNALSLEPPLVLWSLGVASRSLDAFQSARRFAVSVLTADQEALALRFARSGAHRFADIDVLIGAAGVPLIPGALAWFECETVGRHRYGDHELFVGEVRRCARIDGAGLVFEQGGFHRTMPPQRDEDAPAP